MKGRNFSLGRCGLNLGLLGLFLAAAEPQAAPLRLLLRLLFGGEVDKLEG